MRRNDDLLALLAGIALSLAIVARVGEPLARVVPAALIVLFAPGYAASALLFPARTLDRLERLLLAVGLSIATSVLTALALDAADVHLSTRSWSGALAGVTAAAAGGAAWRRRNLDRSADRPSVVPRLGELVMALVAVAVVAASIVVGVATARRPAGHGQGYTVLWARAESRLEGTVALGIESSELHTTRYVLTGTVDDRVVLRRTLTLRSGATWQTTGSVGATPRGDTRVLHVSLSSASAPDVAYRHVDLTLGTLGG